MTETAVDWTTSNLAAASFTPLPRLDVSDRFNATGFFVEDGHKPGVARITVTALYAGQDKYEHWSEAVALMNKLMDVLQAQGAGLIEIKGREPNCAFDVYVPGVGE